MDGENGLHPDLILRTDPRTGRWVLYIVSEDVKGRVESNRRETLLPLAEKYAEWRQAERQAG